MFFYTSLFIASLLVALVLHWLYHVVVDFREKVSREVLPGSRNKSTVDHESRPVRANITKIPDPWGWGEHTNPSQAARTAGIAPSDAVPWGWPGNDRDIHAHGQHSDSRAVHAKPVHGWPYREDKAEFAGKAYKVTRKAEIKRTRLSTAGKPWGW